MLDRQAQVHGKDEHAQEMEKAWIIRLRMKKGLTGVESVKPDDPETGTNPATTWKELGHGWKIVTPESPGRC